MFNNKNVPLLAFAYSPIWVSLFFLFEAKYVYKVVFNLVKMISFNSDILATALKRFYILIYIVYFLLLYTKDDLAFYINVNSRSIFSLEMI